MNNIINNPHDKFFKQTLSNLTVAKQFFTQHLPEQFAQHINLATLSLEKGTFVDKHLQEHLTDLLYKVDIIDQEGYLYLLLEHQSTPDELMAFRLLNYSIKIMQQHLEQHKTKKLPLVYPLVYYTGNRSSAPFVHDIHDCFDNPTLAKEYFLKPFTLIDLQNISDDELSKNKVLAGLQMLQKHIWERDMSLILEEMLMKGVFIAVHNESSDLFYGMIKYLLSRGLATNPEKFLNKLIQQLPTEEKYMMTMAEVLKLEGEKVGIQKGLQKGKQLGKREAKKETLEQTAMKLLKLGKLSINEIAQVTGLKVPAIRKLKSKLA